MMSFIKLLRHLSVSRMKQHKAQTLISVAGICLGVAAIVSIGVVNKSILHSFEDSINQVTGRAALQVTSAESGFPEELLDQVQAVEGVEYAVPVIETKGILKGAKERSVMILGVDALMDHYVRSYRLGNENNVKIPDPLLFLAKPDSILITRAMADREGYAIDQTIQVQTVRGMRSFRIRGLLNPEGPARAVGGNIAIMDIYAAEMAFGKERRIDRIDVSLQPGEDVEVMRNRILAALPEGYAVETPAGRTRQVEKMLANFQRNLGLIGFLAAIVSMYLIFNAVSISVVQRRKEIGILRAIGTTRKQIIRMVLGETFLIAAVGSVLGVGTGILFSKAIIGAFGSIVSELYAKTSVTEITVSWTQLAKGLATGITTSLVAGLMPAVSTARITPVSAIRSTAYPAEGLITSRRLLIISSVFLSLTVVILALYNISTSPRIHNAGLVSLSALFLLIGGSLATPHFLRWFLSAFHRLLPSLFGSVGRLAGLNLNKNISRNSVAAAAIFFGIAIFVSTSGLMYSTKKSILDWIDAIVRTDIFVTAGHPVATAGSQNTPMPADMEKDIEKVPGVLSADPFRKVQIGYEGKKVVLLTVDIERRLSYSSFVVAKGAQKDIIRLLPHQDNIVVNEGFANQFGLKPGDTVTLATPRGPVRFGVAAVVVDYTSDAGAVGMDIHTYRRLWEEMLVDSFWVRVKPGNDIETVRSEIQKRFGQDRDLFVLSAQEYKNEIRKIIDQAFIFNHAVTIISMTIACLGIVVVLLASVLERTRELGVLRSLGTLRKQVSRIVVLESVLLGIAGSALGSAVGVVLGWISLEGFYRSDFGASAAYHIPVLSIVWGMALSAVLSSFAGMYPARRASKIKIVEALSYE